MSLQLNEDRISDLVDHLPKSILDSAPKTHFPIQLPLSFPGPMYHLNLLIILHLVHTTLSQPRHSLYMAETRSDPHELAIRGVFGLFLASDETWGAQNLLSAKSWKQGILDEARIGEFFRLDIMREKDHPTLPVKIGERWKPGVEVAGDLVGLFGRLGEKLQGVRSVCEAVLIALEDSEMSAKTLKGSNRHMAFARTFCAKVIAFERSMVDPYGEPTEGAVLPSAPLRLLQDMAVLIPTLPALQYPIPSLDDLSHLSPLPIPLSLDLHLGLVDLPPSEAGASQARSVQDLLAPLIRPDTDKAEPAAQPAKISTIPAKTYSALQTASVEVCRHIWGAARFSRASDTEGEWKHELSFLDVQRICTELAERLQRSDAGTYTVQAENA